MLTPFRHTVTRLLAAVLLGLLGCAAAASTPQARVERLNAALLESMRAGETAGYPGRRAILEPVLREVFDLALIGRLVLGRHGRELEAGQRDAFLARFADMVIATYASRFDGYSGERIDVVEQRELRGGRQLVRTQLTESDGDTVNLDYVLQTDAGRWRVVNVVADGVSDLSVRRAEYAAIIQREGFDELMRRLAAQIDLLER